MGHRSSNRQIARQSGYALILMVVGLMGLGGAVVVGFTQGAKQDTEHQRYLHNQRVLQEAKQALLQYAYNYPVIDDIGPGRLPNADTDNDGLENSGSTFGRLPWANSNLNLYDMRDADGQRLWYAVSSTFRPQATAVNSDTSGTITLRAQSGGVIFDGSNAAGSTQYGVAAVIIAPGAVIDRNGVGQDRSVANSDNPFDSSPDTDPGIVTASNYLDLVAGTEDNSSFTNGDASDGLILGPVNDLVNDQFIVITAAEVAAMAEMATLQAYRKAINDYLGKTGGVYPWLYNYDGIEYDYSGGELIDVAIDKLSTFFPAGSCSSASGHTEADCVGNGGTWDTSFANEKTTYLGIDTSGSNDGIFGRIPAIFGEYFTAGDSEPIESVLEASLIIDYGSLGTVNASGSPSLAFNPVVDTLSFPISVVLPDLQFENVGGSIGRLKATLGAPENFTWVRYFWDEDEASPTGNWTLCPAGGDNLSDCHRDNSQNAAPGGANDSREEILRVNFQVQLPAGEIAFDADYSTAPALVIGPADLTQHAEIAATFAASDVEFDPLAPPLTPPLMRPIITATYQLDRHYHDGGGETFEIQEFGDLTVADLLAGSTVRLAMRYYPELPGWAHANDWHNSIRMAYASQYTPPGAGACTVDNDCLKLDDFPGTPQNVKSLLVIAGQHNWVDGDPAATVPVAPNGNLKDELKDVFDDGNHNNNPTFYRHRGNDEILVIDEL